MNLEKVEDSVKGIGNTIKRNPLIVVGIIGVVVLIFLFARPRRERVAIKGYPVPAFDQKMPDAVAVPAAGVADFRQAIEEVIARQEAMGVAKLAAIEGIIQQQEDLRRQYEKKKQTLQDLLHRQQDEFMRRQEDIGRRMQEMIERMERIQRHHVPIPDPIPTPPPIPDPIPTPPPTPPRPRIRFDPRRPEVYKEAILRAPIPDRPTREIRNGMIRTAAGHFEPIEDVIARQKERYKRARARGDHKWAEVVRRETEIAIGRRLDW